MKRSTNLNRWRTVGRSISDLIDAMRKLGMKDDEINAELVKRFPDADPAKRAADQPQAAA